MEWTLEIFRMAERPARETIKRELRYRGIFLPNASRRDDLSIQLAGLLSLSRALDFPQGDVADCKKRGSTFRSRRYNPNFDGIAHIFDIPAAIPTGSNVESMQ